jgi:polyphosphate kinase 2 (PPK2 family)
VSDPADHLRVGRGFRPRRVRRAATPGWEAGKTAGKAFLKERGDLLSVDAERLFAQARSGSEKSVLLVVQGLDTAGKGGSSGTWPA